MSEITKNVLFSEVDAKLNMNMSGLINSMQDCINKQTEEIDRGSAFLKSHNRAWFTVSWNIEVKRLPKLSEEITVKTWAYGFSVVTGERNVIITDTDGNDIVCAKITDEDVEGYVMGERYPMEKVSRKIKLPESFDYVEDVWVRKEDLDFNNHMSNGRYIINAYEYVPEGKVKRIRIDYKKQCKYKDELCVFTNHTDNEYIIKFTGKEDGEDRAVVLFEIE